MTKKILIVKGHPREESYCNALADKYIEGARASGAEVQVLDLHKLELEPWLKYDWSRNHKSLPDSPDLDRSKELIMWADRIIFAYPTYWAGPPALVKLWLEMVITAHFAFKYEKPFLGKIPHWDMLLKGRKATLIVTMDAAPFIMDWVDSDPGGKMLYDILRFCGIKLTKKFYAGSVVLSNENKRKQWLDQAYTLGKKEGK